jgi:hypothetical protein
MCIVLPLGDYPTTLYLEQKKRRQKAKILTLSKEIKIPLWNLISTKHKQQSSFISSENSQFVAGEPFYTVPFR